MKYITSGFGPRNFRYIKTSLRANGILYHIHIQLWVNDSKDCNPFAEHTHMLKHAEELFLEGARLLVRNKSSFNESAGSLLWSRHYGPSELIEGVHFPVSVAVLKDLRWRNDHQ